MLHPRRMSTTGSKPFSSLSNKSMRDFAPFSTLVRSVRNCPTASATRRSAAASACSTMLAMRWAALSTRTTNSFTRSMIATAHAVGVLFHEYATSSTMLVSTSWPMPVKTGFAHVATTRASASSSNAARSVFEPPPRITATSSTSSSVARCATAAATEAAAPSPCTRTSHSDTRKPMPDCSSVFMKSA